MSVSWIYILILLLNAPIIFLHLKRSIYYKAPFATVFFWTTFIFTIVGSFFVFFPQYNKSSTLSYLTNDFIYLLLIITVSFYMWFPVHISKQGSTGIPELFDTEHQIKFAKTFALNLMLFSMFLVLLSVAANGVPEFWKFEFFSPGSSVTELVSMRTESLQEASNLWFFQIGFYVLPMFACIVMVTASDIALDGSNVNWKTYAGLAFILSLSFMHKTPSVLLLSSLFLAKVVSGRNNVSASKIFLFGIFILVTIVAWYLVYMWTYGFSYIFGYLPLEITNRLFGAYSMSLAVLISYVDQNPIPLASGLSINPLGLMPEMVNLSRVIHFEIFGFPGNAPAPWIGYAYANFGYLGVIGHLIAINLIIIVLNKVSMLIHNFPMRVAFVTFFCVKIFMLTISSFEEVLINPTLVVTLFIVVLIYHLTKLLHYKKRIVQY